MASLDRRSSLDSSPDLPGQSNSILDGLNGLGRAGRPPHSAASVGMDPVSAFRLVGPGWVSPSASQASSAESASLESASQSSCEGVQESEDDSPVPRFIQPVQEQRLNEDEQGVLSALSLLARTPVKIDAASTPPADDHVHQVSEPSASRQARTPVRIDAVDFVPPAQGPQELSEDESVLSDLSMQSARQRAIQNTPYANQDPEEHYREALRKLADSMMRSEATRRHVVKQRQNLTPEQRRALALAKKRLDRHMLKCLQRRQVQLLHEQRMLDRMASMFDRSSLGYGVGRSLRRACARSMH